MQCPACQQALTNGNGAVTCPSGHRYPVIADVPTLLHGEDAAAVISDTFSAQWAAFDYGESRAWAQGLNVDAVVNRQLEMDYADFVDKRFLDAGCGSGETAHVIATNGGGDVWGTDISASVYRAHQQFPLVNFFRSNLLEPAIAPGSFDVVNAGGVLHHTPSTRDALAMLSRAVRPGGRIFVWLYWKVPGRSMAARYAIRKATARLHPRVQQPIVSALAAAGYLRHRPDQRWADYRLVAHDFYTPRYRWEHTPDELTAWFAELGFVNMKVTDESRDGFGVLAHRP